MPVRVIAPILLGLSALAGCFGRDGVSCEDPNRYATSSTVAPVRVPEGLSVPDETQALRIPPGPALELPEGEDQNPCFEVPPDFFDEDEESGEAQ